MATIRWRRHRLKSGRITKTAQLNWSDKNGKRRRKSLGHITPDAAEDARLAKELELRTGEQIYSFAPMFHELAEDYLNWREVEYPDSQYRIEQLVTQHLVPAFRYVAIDQMKPRQVERYKADRLAVASEETVAKEIRTLKAMLRKAMEWELCRFNPIQSVRPPAARTSRPPHWYSMEELQQIYARAGDRAAIWQLMANTGLRRGEAQQLRLEHDRDDHIVVVSEPGARTKSRKWREIPLSVNARAALDVLEGLTRNDYVLPVMTPQSLTRSFSRDRDALPGTLHSLRHTFGSHLAIKGTPVSVLKELMGHSSIKTTERYLHVARAHLRSAVDGFSI